MNEWTTRGLFIWKKWECTCRFSFHCLLQRAKVITLKSEHSTYANFFLDLLSFRGYFETSESVISSAGRHEFVITFFHDFGFGHIEHGIEFIIPPSQVVHVCFSNRIEALGLKRWGWRFFGSTLIRVCLELIKNVSISWEKLDC